MRASRSSGKGGGKLKHASLNLLFLLFYFVLKYVCKIKQPSAVYAEWHIIAFNLTQTDISFTKLLIFYRNLKKNTCSVLSIEIVSLGKIMKLAVKLIRKICSADFRKIDLSQCIRRCEIS